MKVLALFALFTAASAKNIPFDPDLDEHWETYKRVFDKSYEGREEMARRLIWEQRVADINRHNLRADMGFHSFKKGLNAFSDMEHGEFVQKYTGLKFPSQNSSINASTWLPPSNVKIPDRIDWREHGLVTEVKNQGQCGSCWAFSSTGSLEGQNQKKTGQLVSLSEQNLIDCSKPQGNIGCNGGLMDNAFNYIIQSGGIDTEDSYPYVARSDGPCNFNTHSIGATCTGYVAIPNGDEGALLQAVGTVGPISVTIDASNESFQSYQSGVYNEPKCNPGNLNHAVLVIGYGTEDGTDYWLVKNSWGMSWGLSGYIKMSRNRNNQCGISSHALFPLV